jgi:hypothetical protein
MSGINNPVASVVLGWQGLRNDQRVRLRWDGPYPEIGTVVYAAPVVAQPLTPEQIEAARVEVFKECGADLIPEVATILARAVERAVRGQP